MTRRRYIYIERVKDLAPKISQDVIGKNGKKTSMARGNAHGIMACGRQWKPRDAVTSSKKTELGSVAIKRLNASSNGSMRAL